MTGFEIYGEKPVALRSGKQENESRRKSLSKYLTYFLNVQA